MPLTALSPGAFSSFFSLLSSQHSRVLGERHRLLFRLRAIKLSPHARFSFSFNIEPNLRRLLRIMSQSSTLSLRKPSFSVHVNCTIFTRRGNDVNHHSFQFFSRLLLEKFSSFLFGQLLENYFPHAIVILIFSSIFWFDLIVGRYQVDGAFLFALIVGRYQVDGAFGVRG